MLPPVTAVWEISDMAGGGDEFRGRRLYDAFMAIKPKGLVETDWAISSGVNRGFFTNLKSADISPRGDTIRKLLKHIGRAEADLYTDRPVRRSLPTTIDKAPDRLPTRDASAGDETAEITVLDLSLPMGPGADIEDYIEESTMRMDIGLLRSLTRSPFNRLRIVKGIGDSMEPTLKGGDLVIIDTTYNRLDFEDRIWACRIRGLGGIKRLRSAPRSKVRVISDNPDLPNDLVDEADLAILGRVVGAIRMM